MRNCDALWRIVEKHRALDGAVENSQEEFLSDWNGSHPFVARFLNGAQLLPLRNNRPEKLSHYHYFDREPQIFDSIKRLHAAHDGIDLSRSNVVAGAGSSSFLVAFSLWLIQQGYEEIFYVPPLYYTFHYFLRTLSLRLRPVSGKHLFEANAKLNLPPRRSVLLLCDPIWFAGRRLTADQIAIIADWQRRTRSIVFVDGSFQYTQWDGERREYSAILDRDLTFRLISPTKALAIPAFRFAYLLLPSRYHQEFLFLYESMMGGVNVTDVMFAERSLSILVGDPGNRPLTSFFQQTYEQLISDRLITRGITPDCGYFAFAVPTARLPRGVTMTQEYFELRRHPDHVRVNLMIAARLIRRSSASRRSDKTNPRMKQ
jgi:aspartate/methionine/tyrosine aminotransferase